MVGEPRLVADIGGTHARLALERDRGRFDAVQVLVCDDYDGIEALLRAYLTQCGEPVRHAAIAIANPIEGDAVRMTNRHWSFSIDTTRQALGLETLLVVNDFTALASALPALQPVDRRAVGGGQALPGQPIAVLGPGTGLGVSGLVPHSDGYVALMSEGGHTSFAPRDEREDIVLAHARRQYGHVSFERVASGMGLELIYAALNAHRGGRMPSPMSAADIVRRAVAEECVLCAEVVDVFAAVLGTAASDLALTLGARGGVYIGGGIVPRLGARFDASPFRARFEDKGRFSAYLQAIPTWVLTHATPALIGAAAMLETRLRAQHS